MTMDFKIFDPITFNKKFNEVQNIARQKKLERKKKLAKPINTQLEYKKINIDELKKEVYLDIHNMFKDFAKLKSFDINKIGQIMSINYRKLTVLIILLILFVITYLLISFLN